MTQADTTHTGLRIADAIEQCDWSGCSIGNKTILRSAVAELRKAAPPAPQETAGEAVAWSYELATTYNKVTGEYGDWGQPKVSFEKPCVPKASIRNLKPLTHPTPAEATSREPMTDEDIQRVLGASGVNNLIRRIVRSVEQHHGITPKSTPEAPQ